MNSLPPNPPPKLKTLRKIIVYASIALAALLLTASLLLWIFKDHIIQQFIREANKNLNTPVKIGKVDISMWRDFPNLSIVFDEVYVEDSQPGNYPLLTAEHISFSLSPIDVWGGNYAIKALEISGSETNLKIDERGTTNYNIMKNTEGGQAKSVVFDLKDIHLSRTLVRYHDRRSHQDHIFKSSELTASISLKENRYDIDADGSVTTEQIKNGSQIYLKNKTFDVVTKLIYDDANKNISIGDSKLVTGKSKFDVKGNYTFGSHEYISLTAKGTDTDIQTLVSLLPDDVSRKLSAYRSSGEVYLSVALKGNMGEHKSPSLSISFGCNDASFYHPDYKSKIEHATLEGSFATPAINDLSRAALFLKKVSGQLNGKTFTADFSLQNFDNPLVGLEFKGALDAASLLNFYPVDEIKQLSGEVVADVSFQGRVSLLKKKSTAQQVKTRGSIEMKNIELTAGQKNIRFRNLNGALQFNNNDLALSDVSGRFGDSDFRLNGFFKNVITWFIFENQPIGIETDLRCDFLDLDQLLSIGFSEKGSGDFNFRISPLLHLNFNCDLRSVTYQRLKARNVKGDLLVKNQMAVSRNITLNTMGGLLSLNGIVDAKNPKAIDIVSSWKLTGIHLDSVFYVFKNFNQQFIQDHHLKGQSFADVSLEMTLNEKLNLYPETLVADIGVAIRNGELNKFEPMQKLNAYLDDEGLSKLRFADLKNDIHIEKKTIYIPQMEVKTNVTTIQLSGTHSFDQHIDYRIAAPLRSKRKIDTDEAFGAIEEDHAGHSKIFLKILGTTDKYTISYDKQAVKQKIRSDLRKEVLELKDAFKNKGMKKKKEAELEKEEYFDWD